MNESSQIEYFRKPGTIAPSMGNSIELPKAIEEAINTIEYMDSSPNEALINQDIIKVGDYHKNKAIRKEIGHVRFEPD